MDVDADSCEVGICIKNDMQDKHYGTEAIKRIIDYAFNDIKLKKIRAIVFSNNERSMHLVEKVGFKKTSIVENVKTVDGASVSEVNFILER